MSSHSSARSRKDIVRIVCDYMSGALVDTICTNYGMSKETLYLYLKRENIEHRRNDADRHFRNAIFGGILNDKKTLAQISKDMGIALDIVQQYTIDEYTRSEAREVARNKRSSRTTVETAKKQAGAVNAAPVAKREEKPLGKDGLIGLLPSSSNQGLNISQTLEERNKRESAESADDETKDDKLVGMFNEEWTEAESLKLSLLRELLRHAATVTTLPDYSTDGLLVPDLLLPVDIVIMKDITERSVSGEDVKSIAALHRTDVALVADLLNGGMSRDVFRDRFIKSLVSRGLIQL